MRAAWESSDRIVSFMASLVARAGGVCKLPRVTTVDLWVIVG